MSDAGDDIPVEAPAAVEVATEAPKGKLSVEDALQVGSFFSEFFYHKPQYFSYSLNDCQLLYVASIEKRSRSRRSGSRSS